MPSELSFGVKSSKRSSVTWLSGTYSTNLYGPVPMNSISFGPFAASSAGMMTAGGRGEAKASRKSGVWLREGQRDLVIARDLDRLDRLQHGAGAPMPLVAVERSLDVLRRHLLAVVEH